MDIKRQQYLDQLIASQRNGLIKIITGIRSKRLRVYTLHNSKKQ